MTTQSLLTRIPENTSLLQSARFTFSFPKLPFLKYFCQAVQLPGVSTSAVQVSNPFADTYRHGDKLVYEPFVITALLDEDIRVWEETYDWLTAMTKPQLFAQYGRFFDERRLPYHDGVLTINTNSNIQNVRVLFKDCHPTSLNGIPFDTKINADSTFTAEIGFRYDYFTIERLTI